MDLARVEVPKCEYDDPWRDEGYQEALFKIIGDRKTEFVDILHSLLVRPFLTRLWIIRRGRPPPARPDLRPPRHRVRARPAPGSPTRLRGVFPGGLRQIHPRPPQDVWRHFDPEPHRKRYRELAVLVPDYEFHPWLLTGDWPGLRFSQATRCKSAARLGTRPTSGTWKMTWRCSRHCCGSFSRELPKLDGSPWTR
jgi:hypothetical protein